MLEPVETAAVVFDMGGVFVVPAPEPINRILSAAGVEYEFGPADAHRAHYTAVRALTDRLADERIDERDLDVWSHYDRAYFGAVGIDGDERLRAVEERDRHRRAEVVEDMWTHVLTHNVEAFARIAVDRPVAIVTNNTGTAIQQCLDHGICQLDEGPLPRVAAIVDSGVIRIAKPDPRIFHPALEALGTDPARTLYVGDTVHADVHGAAAAGMAALQLDPLELHGDHDHWRLPDLVALAEHLGS